MLGYSAISISLMIHDIMIFFEQSIMLVGGFGESPYLFKKVDYTWSPKGIKVINPEKS